MSGQLIRCTIFLAGLLIQSHLFAEDVSKYLLPDDPKQAWEEVDKMHATLRPPDVWREKPPTDAEVQDFQAKVRRSAIEFAHKAQEFALRFPTDENAGDSRVWCVWALGHAVAAGDADAEQRAADFVSSVLADESLPEDNRVTVLLYSGNTPCMKNVGMRLFTEGMSKLNEEFEIAFIDSLRSAQKQFPANATIYSMLVGIAQRSTGDRQSELANEVINAPNAPAGTKTLARHVLAGTKPYEVGKPLDIRFKALDGREVDLVKLKGKVVLVEFWSTDCGPCVGQLPMLKAVYEKLHERGFEVVAISLDDKEGVLRRFIHEKEVPWPQHFDRKGWGNEFASRYGIFSIPTTWLVDRQGNLRDVEPRFDLENRVTALLDEDPSAAN